jgi:hypothetical protein
MLIRKCTDYAGSDLGNFEIESRRQNPGEEEGGDTLSSAVYVKGDSSK